MLDTSIDIKKPFVLIEKQGWVRAFQGTVYALNTLDEIHSLAKQAHSDVVFGLPYRMIRERGFEARGDEPILAMAVEVSFAERCADFRDKLPKKSCEMEGDITPSMTDEEYADMVARFQQEEIGGGNTSQTTLCRRFSGQIRDFDITSALALYRCLLERRGHYMAVLFANMHTQDPEQNQFIIGATPEKHLEIHGNTTTMVPIAGTLRKNDKHSFANRLKRFIRDDKEINELFQVMDEEMKMMGLICPEGGTILGPFLREIGAVVHTEYMLKGKRGTDTIRSLRQTLHAPTVIGSPMESAARIIAKYEPESRRYYAGEIGIYHEPEGDMPDGDLDSAILIRCAEISGDGRFEVRAGGGLVRNSTPQDEARESRAKAMGIMDLFLNPGSREEQYLDDTLKDEVAEELAARNETLSPFWMQKQNFYLTPHPDLKDLDITVINNEDDFAHMISHMARGLGAKTRVVDTLNYAVDDDPGDIVIVGPGPGDPGDTDSKRMIRLREIVATLRKRGRRVLGVCLGHQALALHEGLEVERQPDSSQGMPRTVKVFGHSYTLGFYNSFSPVFTEQARHKINLRMDVDDENRIIAMQGDRMIGFQFHPESVMSAQGYVLMEKALLTLKNAL